MSRLVWIALLQIVIILSALQLGVLGLFQESPKDKIINALKNSGTVVKDHSQVVGSLGETLTLLGKVPIGLAKVVTDVVAGTKNERPLERESFLDHGVFIKQQHP